MRSNTTYHWGFRNVGDAEDSGTYGEWTIREAVLALVRWTAEVSLAGSLLIVATRSLEETQHKLMNQGKGKQAKATDDIDAEILALFAEFDENDGAVA